MNVIETISNELKGKHLTDLEKTRYIYIRCCELFSFDYRWFYADINGDRSLKLKIANRDIDLENVNDFSVICHTATKRVLKPLINMFTSLEAKSITTEIEDHSYLIVKDNNDTVWKLDTAYGDLAKVKLNVVPTGMFANSKGSEYLKEIDAGLGYNFIEEEDYSKVLTGTNLQKIEMASKMLDESTANNYFTDANFFYKLTVRDLLDDDSMYCDDKYDFHRTSILLEGPKYFDLGKHDGKYSIKEIDMDTYNDFEKRLINR